MGPRNYEPSLVYEQNETDDLTLVEPTISSEANQQKRPPPPLNIVWLNVLRIGGLHLAALFGICLLPFTMWKTWLLTIVLYFASAMGITAGAHRLWAHRSYRAKTPLRILLAIMQTSAVQNDIIEWVRDHRVHHRHSETDADPHNAKRGFFFSHVGWLLVRKHPEVKEKGQLIDLSDVLNDPVCYWQRKFYFPLSLLIGFILPAVVAIYGWGESALVAIFVPSILRYVLVLNATWCVNSIAHLWGMKPYDKNINPADSLFVAFGAAGEGFHNYHHTFPHDYSTSEFGWRFNMTTFFIDTFAKLGQVTHRKKLAQELVERRKLRSGDQSVPNGLKFGGLF